MTNKQKEGFTIIEVVLVLAIAGLIFLVVFLALPALQRSQRDTARKNDLGRFMSQISSYQSNNRGAVPANADLAATFVPAYLTMSGAETFADPQKDDYTYATGAGTPTVGTIQYAVGGRCGANGAVAVSGNNRQIAASVGLEGGGAYCQQN